MKINYYHFHIYYNPTQINEAMQVTRKLAELFQVPIGRHWDKPVGPHPIGSCQVSVPTELFGEICSWLILNREGFDFFIHPDTGNDLLDHTEHAMWLGKSYPLKTEIFT